MTRPGSTGSSPDGARTLLRLLTSLARSDESLSVDDLTAEHGLAPAAARRALRMLAEEGFAAVDPGSGQYVVGLKFIQLAKLSRGKHLLEREIRPIMRELAQAAGETVTLNTYAPGATSALCVMVEESPAPLHYAVEVGEMKPLHAGSSGKAILAHLSDAAIEAYIERTGLPPLTARTVTDPKALWREIRKIRKQGYARSRGQRLDGAVAIAGSVFDGDGAIHASLVLTIPAYRYRTADAERIVELVKQAASRISDLMRPRGKP
jgi:DNA-binding IclR family transcriptional regulator